MKITYGSSAAVAAPGGRRFHLPRFFTKITGAGQKRNK